jgi:hypothetical protein
MLEALEAIGDELDESNEILAGLSGRVEQAVELAIDTRDDVRALTRAIETLSGRVGQALDRLGEVDELRGKIARLELEADRG